MASSSPTSPRLGKRGLASNRGSLERRNSAETGDKQHSLGEQTRGKDGRGRKERKAKAEEKDLLNGVKNPHHGTEPEQQEGLSHLGSAAPQNPFRINAFGNSAGTTQAWNQLHMTKRRLRKGGRVDR